MIRGGRRLFPVSLYATLLLALCCVAAPGVPRQVQGWLQALVCLPLRGWAVVATPVRAAAAPDEEVAARAATLQRRLEWAARENTAAWRPVGWEPLLCRVVSRGERGAAGLPESLWLDHFAEDLAGCAGYVTYGDQLIGFLADPEDAPVGVRNLARVDLLHARPHERPRRVAAAADVEGGPLRFVVEPAGRIDRWPLRCRVLEDPYRAAQLRHSGYPVRTAELPGDPLGTVPAQLLLGHMMVWGYADEDSAPIDLFVVPELDARALPAVVVWRPRAAALPLPQSATAVRQIPVERVAVPPLPPASDRWLLTADRSRNLPSGAALVRGGRLCGVVEQGGPGFGTAIPLGQSRHAWSLVLLPDRPTASPVFVLAHGVGQDGDVARLVVEVGADRLEPGVLFTGPNGPHFPQGWLIGDAQPEGAMLRVTIPSDVAGPLSVCTGEVLP